MSLLHHSRSSSRSLDSNKMYLTLAKWRSYQLWLRTCIRGRQQDLHRHSIRCPPAKLLQVRATESWQIALNLRLTLIDSRHACERRATFLRLTRLRCLEPAWDLYRSLNLIPSCSSLPSFLVMFELNCNYGTFDCIRDMIYNRYAFWQIARTVL